MKPMMLALVIALFTAGCVSQQPTSTVNSRSLSKPGLERLNAGWGYMGEGQYQRAKHHLDRALEHDPSSARVYAALGYYYSQVGEYKSAEQAFETSIKLDNQDGENMNLYGVFLCREGKYAAAEKMFERVLNIRTYGNMSSTFENAGLCALRTNNAEKAEQYFLRAVRHNPKQAQSLLELANIEFAKQNMARAKGYLDRYTAVGSESARSLWLGIQLAYEQGDRDALASLGLKLERLFPDSEETVQYLNKRKQWRK